MKKRWTRFAIDFETTVYEGQERTEVWSAACAAIDSNFTNIFTSIDSFFRFFERYPGNIMMYVHNEKFDGEFILYYYLAQRGFKNAFEYTDDRTGGVWLDEDEMPSKTIQYVISDIGQWYKITIRVNGKFIEIRDSLKLIPFSLAVAGKSFGTEHQKLEMEYTGYRHAGGEISEEERKYILHDVLVLKECLQYMFKAGHEKLTIGSCCLDEYKAIYSKKKFNRDFPDLFEIELDPDVYGAKNADQYVRRAYRGGWCYVKKSIQGIPQTDGCVYDVNSLYPSVMLAESGSWYPYGEPHFWKGNFLPDVCKTIKVYYYLRIRCRFWLRPGYLPFVQIKTNAFYKKTECLETSDIWDPVRKQYVTEYRDLDGNPRTADMTLTLSCVDFALMLEHYVVDYEILDGCWFDAKQGIFDDYITKYREMKENAPNKGIRTIAKLFSNNLYGKMATSNISSFRLAEYGIHDDMLHFRTIFAEDKRPGFIPVGAAITSYARNFTIRAAQQNYNYFCYADTDSMHLACHPDQVRGIRVDDKKYCCWKCESVWDRATFVRQKTYVEHIRDGDSYEWEIKCAGLPQRSKDLFLMSIGDYHPKDGEKVTRPGNQRERDFVATPRTIDDFKVGLTIPGKLLPKRFPGGVVLMETDFTLQ